MARLLVAAALLAGAAAAPAATAYPCEGMTVPQCTAPLRDKIEHLCVPPDPGDPYGC